MDFGMIQRISWFVQLTFDSSRGEELALALAWWGSWLDVLENVETRFFFFAFSAASKDPGHSLPQGTTWIPASSSQAPPLLLLLLLPSIIQRKLTPASRTGGFIPRSS